MSASAMALIAPVPKPKRLIQVTALAWLAIIGFDLLMNAGVLARFYNWQLPGFIPPMKMFLYIPFGYAAFLLHVILLLWLIVRTNTRGAWTGAAFGAKIGVLLAAAAFLGWLSIFAFPATMLFCWALDVALNFALAGAVIGSGLAAARLRPLTLRVIALFLICVIGAFVAQNLGSNSAAKMQHGRIGIGWNPKR